MRGVVLYALIAAAFLALPVVLLPFRVPPETGFSLALLAAIGSGIVAAFRVRAIYAVSTVPRSVFFGMLVTAIEIKAAAGAWFAYLVAANLLGRADILLPTPEQPVRVVISGVLAIVVLLSPVYYALTIELERRKLSRDDAAERAVVMDRLTHPPGER